jgi:hypothetical protein
MFGAEDIYADELGWICPSFKELIIAAIREMHEADDAYGAGFYGNPRWRKAYNRTRALIGMPTQEDT